MYENVIWTQAVEEARDVGMQRSYQEACVAFAYFPIILKDIK